MRKFLAALPFLFAAYVAIAAPTLIPTTGAGVTGGTGGGAAFSGAGDAVSGASVWWGLRAYNAAYAAPGTNLIANIRRASDSQTCDILAATNGGVGLTANCSGAANGSTPTAFCNATTCFVTKLYDQSGANSCTAGTPCNLTQTNTALQPGFNPSCLTGKPCFFGTGTQFIGINAAGQLFTTGVLLPYTVSLVAIRTANFTTLSGTLGTSNGTNVQARFDNAANQYFCYGGTAPVTAAQTDNVTHSLTCTFSSGATVMYVDNVSTSGAAATAALVGGNNWITPMSDDSTTDPLQGNEFEVGVWPIAFSAGQAATMCHNQFVYWGTGVSC